MPVFLFYYRLLMMFNRTVFVFYVNYVAHSNCFYNGELLNHLIFKQIIYFRIYLFTYIYFFNIIFTLLILIIDRPERINLLYKGTRNIFSDIIFKINFFVRKRLQLKMFYFELFKTNFICY